MLDEQDKPELAVQFYKKCVNIDSNPKVNTYLSSALTNIAAIYEEVNKTEFAIRYYQEALKIDEKTSNYNGIYLSSIKLAEIFASKSANIQVFFTDFFGIKDTYNKPGTSGDKNWSLRVPDNFEEVYCSNLKDNGLALNLPLILKMAIEARGSKFASKHKGLLKDLQELI